MPKQTDAKKNTDDAGEKELQKTFDAIEEKGFLGDRVDPNPPEAYSLETGPEAPHFKSEDARTQE